MKTAAEGFSFGRLYIMPRLSDYAQLTKSRVTTLIIMTAWCGFFFGARKAGLPVMSWSLLHALLGIGMVSSGTAALNEVMEHEVDSKMRRTARRPIPSGRMSLLHASIVGTLLAVGGSIYLVAFYELAYRTTDLSYVGDLPFGLHPAKADFACLYVCWRISRCDAGRSGLDCGSWPPRLGYSRTLCDSFSVAISTFLCHRVDVSRRLCQRLDSHASRGRAGRAINNAANPAL